MADLTLKVTNRSRKGLKGLPPTIELPSDATVEQAKRVIASATKTSDFNRIGIFDPASKKTIKDKNAVLSEQEAVVKHGEILVKDLGAQISWRAVYLTEYFGPLIFHPLFLGLRNHIYPALSPLVSSIMPEAAKGAEDGALSTTQKTAFALIMAHFVKRELEVLFVHKFSANTMPAAFIVRNSFFYWVFAGLLGALEIYAPWSPAARADAASLPTYVGLGLYVFGQICNANVHWYLSTLRKPGETARKIPNGLGFNLVTCPNYMFEIIAWIGIILVTRSPTLVVFISIGSYYMHTWGWGKEKAYRKQFGDKYKKKRYVMLPGLL
ncbi:3-oxo-5-alpha-steroid 4-dehydrogenase-domain-containing protein [Xylariomycetidae sp. FL0641]|nr:3-oxo-5-alpha-steroid 4-dehydrogenase-domain-containing protein [Xylariomycetidae sp. FL0641]